ncbi:MAG: FtsQ-type POTRA domain-containing protein, partial [Gammaproteobacteria bacterium]
MKRQRRNRRIARTPVCCNNYLWIVLVTVFVVVDLTALVAWAVTRISDPAAMPIREVFIEGEFRHIKPGDLRALIAQEVHAGFFTVGVKEIQDDLSHNPWI